MRSLASVLLPALATAQDPAPGWMAYAKGTIPAGTERITRLEMTWTVGAEAGRSVAFFSPWFGMDPSDNLNLLQPVNPFSGAAKSWSMYTEYFQFMPPWNSNSKKFRVKSGQTLHGSIVYREADDSYLLSQSIVETGDTSSQVVKCQRGKKFVTPYVVYEKKWPCSWYPPDGEVTFRNITVECDGADCSHDVHWEPKVKDAHCNMRAVIDEDHNEISLRWDTKATSSMDEMAPADMVKLNAASWGARFAERALAELERESIGRDAVASSKDTFAV